MRTLVFPGQGSQHQGMGGALFDELEQYGLVEKKVDELLGYSVRELCRNDTQRRLSQTQYTQPCLYTVNWLHFCQCMARGGPAPSFFAGHSLGEYNALLAAGAFDFLTGLALVQKRGELMARAREGGMAAVIGATPDRIQALLREHQLDSLDIANYNAPNQTVVAGPLTTLEAAYSVFAQIQGVRFIPLPVSAAFHSRYMLEAAEAFREFSGRFVFHRLELPVISNVTGAPYPDGASCDQIRDLLAKQMHHPVLWKQSVEYLLRRGVTTFEETGPGSVLTRLCQQIQSAGAAVAPARSEARKAAHEVDADAGGSLRSIITATRERAESEASRVRFVIAPDALGSAEFRRDHGLTHAYVAGSMYKGIASKEMVVALGKSGLLGYLGTGGMRMPVLEDAISQIQSALGSGEPYGMNLLCDLTRPDLERETVELYLRRGIRRIEAAAYMQVTAPLIRYRLTGARRGLDGAVICPNSIMAKVSRPEVAQAFMEPPPAALVEKLVAEGQLTRSEALLAGKVPVAQDVCVEADSGGHTDRGVAYALMPAMLSLRDEAMDRYRYSGRIRVGAAGGIGTPEAAAAAFMLGADFVLTGSINQCTVEAGTSDEVKALLQQANVQDTAYAPAGDMFELGAKVQVLRRGLFFPARANKLYELYQRHESLDEIDEKTRRQIQDQYFKRSFGDVWAETKAYHARECPRELERAESVPKYKMALIFKWYFVHSTRLAMRGSQEQKVDYQIHCGPAMGAFNRWMRGTELESWRNRRVADLGQRIMRGAADLLAARFAGFASASSAHQHRLRDSTVVNGSHVEAR